MAWVRIHDGAMTHPKLVGLSDKAFRLWVWGLSYTQMHLTNGLIVVDALPSTLKRATADLIAKRLWETHDLGFTIHDYLDWNDSKEAVMAARKLGRHRIAFLRDPDLKRQLRARDGDQCRYCGKTVNWLDRKGANGATYDHIDPRGEATMENLVIACRGCNSSKRNRTPEQAGMCLRQIGSRSDLDRKSNHYLGRINDSTSGVGISTSSLEEKDDAIFQRAGRLREELYPAWYAKHRHGARLRLVASPLEFQEAITICKIWDDARLEKLATIFLTTDDDWISKTDRSFRLFVSKSSWCDDRLTQWEREHGKASA